MSVVESQNQHALTALLNAFRNRDPNAVRALYRMYGKRVYAVAYGVLRRSDLAENATQQTFLRAWQAADRLDADRDPGPWLATIAKRTAIDLARHEARRATVAFNDAADDVPAMSPPDLESVDLVWRVRGAIDELPPEQATIIRLQHLEGMTYAEIAEHLGIALGTVKSRSHRAHARLATMLGRLRTDFVA